MLGKLKLKSSWIGLFLIGVMLFSTFAYAVIQSFYSRQRIELPETNVIDYRLNDDLRDALIQYRATFLTFEYNPNCNECLNQKFYLETLAQDYQEQIFLEELLDNNQNTSTLTITSLYGEKELVNPNETEIFSSICELLVSPPPTCVLLQ